MQLRLLNFYKFLSNFANNLVGAFIELIVFNVTMSLPIAFVYCISEEAIRLLVSYFLRAKMRKNPQIFLLLRIITLTGYNVLLLLLDVMNIWVCICGVCIFLAFDTSFKSCSNELIYNYSSLNKNTNSLGITRLIEQMGVIASLLIGGYLLDINRILVISISLILYFISLIPLLMYYFKSRQEKTFNKDATSNAYETLKKDTLYNKYSNRIIFKILLSYFIVYFVYCSFDIFRMTFTLELFVKGSDKYSIAGLFGAIFNGMYGVGSYIAGKINDRYDATWLVMVACVVMATGVTGFIFVDSSVAYYLLFGVIGFVYPFISLFVLQRLLVKSRIMGVSNSALLTRENACTSSYVVFFGFALLFSLFPNLTLWPVYVIIAICLLYSTIAIPANEEKTRKLLVDYLENNEILNKEKENIEIMEESENKT